MDKKDIIDVLKAANKPAGDPLTTNIGVGELKEMIAFAESNNTEIICMKISPHGGIDVVEVSTTCELHENKLWHDVTSYENF
jgi:hypothetical protein